MTTITSFHVWILCLPLSVPMRKVCVNKPKYGSVTVDSIERTILMVQQLPGLVFRIVTFLFIFHTVIVDLAKRLISVRRSSPGGGVLFEYMEFRPVVTLRLKIGKSVICLTILFSLADTLRQYRQKYKLKTQGTFDEHRF